MRQPDQTARGKINRLSKWRTVFAGWQLGTRPKGDAECDAVRDHRELSIMMRADINALVGLLVKKGIMTADEFTEALGEEAVLLAQDFERKFPGFMATDDGIVMDPAIARETTKNWRP